MIVISELVAFLQTARANAQLSVELKALVQQLNVVRVRLEKAGE